MLDPPLRRSRLVLVDVARGIALAAMIVYHTAWDLGFLGLLDPPIAETPPWQAFARLIAASFLAIVGVSLTLATRNGLNGRAYLKRLGVIVAAALAVTAGTYWFVPEDAVFFGILHMIAAGSVLALLFLRLPSLVLLAMAAVVFYIGQTVRSAAFDPVWLLPLGLAENMRASVDYVPIFPWFSAVLVGLVIGRWLDRFLPERWKDWTPRNAIGRFTAAAGRHSLPIYLLHQPVLIGVFFAVAWTISPPAAETRFMSDCERSCVGYGRSVEVCHAACQCTMETAKRENVWARASIGAPDAATRERINEIARTCAPR